jgi:hypothetical protein
MVVGERVRPVEGLLQRRDLPPERAVGQLGQRLRVSQPPMSASMISREETPCRSETTTDSFSSA